MPAPPDGASDALPAREATFAALAVVALAFVFNFIGRGVADAFAVFILPLETERGWSRSAMTGVFATYMLTAGLAAPAAGLLFDRCGPRCVYGIGLLLLGGGACFSAAIDQPWHLYLTSGLMVGLGVAALGMVSAAALISRWYVRNLPTAIAFAYAGFGCGMLVVLPLTQHLIDSIGWRAAYLTLGLVVLACVPFCLLLPWHRLAAPGAGRIAAALTPSVDDWTLSRAGRSAPFWRLVQVFFFTALAIYAVTPQTVAFLVESGYSPLWAASAFGAAGLLSTAGVVGSGWLSQRIGFARTALFSFMFTGAGLLALVAISFAPSLAALGIYVACFGIAQGARGPIVSTLSNRLFAGGHVGTIYGVVYCSMSLGAALGAWLGGLMHDAFGGYRPVFMLSLAAVLLAAEPFRAGAVLARGGTRLPMRPSH